MSGRSNLAHIARHAGFDAVGSVISMIVMFVSSVVITRTIGADLYGKFSIANNVLMVGSVIALFGIEVGVMKITSKYIAKNIPALVLGALKGGIVFAGLISLGITIAVYVLAPQIASGIFPNVEGIIWVLRAQIIALPFLALMTVINHYTMGFKTLKYNVLIELISRPIVRLGLILFMFRLGLRLEAVIYGTVLSFVVAMTLSATSAIRISKRAFGQMTSQPVTRELLTYSVPIALAHIAGIVTANLNTLIVGHFKNSVDTGLFSIAAQLSLYVSISLLSFARIFSPVASDLWERQRIDELGDTLKTVSKWIFTLGLLVFTVVLLFAPSILMIFGKDFVPGAKAFRILAAGQIMNTAGGLIGYLLPMTGRQKLNLVNCYIFAAIALVLTILMTPVWGIAGTALATSISALVSNVVRIIQAKLLYGFTPFSKDFLIPVVAGSITGLILYVVDRGINLTSTTMGTIAICLAATAIYGFLLYKLGFKQEKDILLAAIGKK